MFIIEMRICASEMIDFMHKTNTMKLTIKPLSPDLLKDYLYFFDHVVFAENPDWSACYCFSFHFTGSNEQWKKETNRASACDFIKEGKLTGYLVYDDDKPIGWCNVNVRSNYQRLMKYYDLVDNPDDKVCSIVCFLIHPDYRRMGIAKKYCNKSIPIILHLTLIIWRLIPGKVNYPVKDIIKDHSVCTRNSILKLRKSMMITMLSGRD